MNDRTGVRSFLYAHHFSLYFLIRLFSGIGYPFGVAALNAARLTSRGVWHWNLSCGRSSE